MVTKHHALEIVATMDQENDEFVSWLSVTKPNLDAAASTVAETIVDMFKCKALGGFSSHVDKAKTTLKNSVLPLNEVFLEGRQERQPV